MIRRQFRLIVLAGAAAGVAGVVRAMTGKDDPLPTPATEPTGGPWPPLRNETMPPRDEPREPSEAPPAPGSASATTSPAVESMPRPASAVSPEPDGVPVADAPPAANASWVEPTAEGSCPAGHPVKAKMTSKIFHSPGQLNYDRTTPDRCYVDAAAAEADGLRAAKR